MDTPHYAISAFAVQGLATPSEACTSLPASQLLWPFARNRNASRQNANLPSARFVTNDGGLARQTTPTRGSDPRSKGKATPTEPRVRRSAQLQISANFYEIAVRIPKVKRDHLAIGTVALNWSELDRYAAAFEMGAHLFYRHPRDETEIGSARRWRQGFRIEGAADFMHVDLLLSERHGSRAGGIDALKPEHTLVERAGRFERTDGDNEVVYAVDHTLPRKWRWNPEIAMRTLLSSSLLSEAADC